MVPADKLEKMAEKVRELQRIAQELEKESDDFPAINRNAKRIITSAEMLRINLEQG